MSKIHKLGKRITNHTGGMPGTILYRAFERTAVLMCILFFSFAYSQEGFDTPPLITVRGDAQIYSSDPDFNHQFTAQGNTRYTISNLGKALVFKSKDPASGKRYAKLKAKFSVQTIDRVDSRKLRKTVSDFEHRKKSFNFCHLNGAPFSRELPYSSDSSQAYVIPSTTSHDFSKVCISQCKLLTSLVLERLYLEKYHYFNNRSFDFCFSEVFSIRPPPLFIV